MYLFIGRKKFLMILIVIIVLLGTISTTFAAEDAQIEIGSGAYLPDFAPGIGVWDFQSDSGFWYEWDAFPEFSNILRPIQPWGIDARNDVVLPLN